MVIYIMRIDHDLTLIYIRFICTMRLLDGRIELKRKLDMMDVNEDTRDGEEGSA